MHKQIVLTIEKAALKRGITSQRQLAKVIEERTGEVVRAATISDFYRNNKTGINREHLLTIMKGLEITDFNEVFTLE